MTIFVSQILAETGPTAGLQKTVTEPANEVFRRGLLSQMAGLRAYATILARSSTAADDLVQETLLRALRYSDKFEAGSSLKAWLFTILRNRFYGDLQKNGRVERDIGGVHAATLSEPPSQYWSARCRELLHAMQRLSASQREILTLVATGASYEEIAEFYGCAIGAVKSRIHRARVRFVQICDEAEIRAPKAWLNNDSRGLKVQRLGYVPSPRVQAFSPDGLTVAGG